jgi:Fe-S-cluster-containing hydrogenase component 2
MHHFIVADPSRCIGCYACVAACVESHHEFGLQAYPRLYIIHASPAGTMPLQCHHCDEPYCVLVCPVKAITCIDNAIILNESLCIGCKLCALACPFGAIIPGGTPLPKFEFNVGQYTYLNTPYQPDPMYLREFALQERLSLLNWSAGQKTTSVKCDLCYFREQGPACVLACPHKALSLVEEGGEYDTKFVKGIKTVRALEDEQV